MADKQKKKLSILDLIHPLGVYLIRGGVRRFGVEHIAGGNPAR